MTKVALEYNSRNIEVHRLLDKILSMRLFRTKTFNPTVKKSRLERSLADVEKGKVFFLAGPKQP